MASTVRIHLASLSIGASVDQQTGSLSVFEILEEIRAPQVPLNLPSLVLSVLAEKLQPGPFTGKVHIHLITPDQKQQLLGTADLQVPAEQKKMKAVFRFGPFPVMAFGTHRFVLSWMSAQNQKVGEALADFDVIQDSRMEAPPAPQGGQGPQGVAH